MSETLEAYNGRYLDYINAEADECDWIQQIAEAILDCPTFSVYNNEDFLLHAARVTTAPDRPGDPEAGINQRVALRFLTDDPNQMPNNYEDLFLLTRVIYEDRLDR